MIYVVLPFLIRLLSYKSYKQQLPLRYQGIETQFDYIIFAPAITATLTEPLPNYIHLCKNYINDLVLSLRGDK